MSHEREQVAGRSTSKLKRDERLTLPQKTIPLKHCLRPGGQVDFEIAFFEQVIAADPCHEDALWYLGAAYTDDGDYRKGLEIDRRLVRLRPDDPTALYNLACSYSLLQRVDKAIEALGKAISLGYSDLKHMETDADLELLRRDPRYEGLRAVLLEKHPPPKSETA